MKKWYFEIIKGKILWYFPTLWDGKYKIVEIKVIRSPEANRYYWGYIIKYIVLMYKEAWIIHTKDHIHDLFKKAFLHRDRIYSDFTKKYIFKYGSTTTLTKSQFAEFIKNIKIICEFWKLWEIKGLEPIEPFVIPDIDEDELLNWIDKIV